MTRSARRSRPAFTLLEVMLASLIGALVVIACLALFSTINIAQERHEFRSAQTSDLTRAHTIIQRSLQTLVMAKSDGPGDSDSVRRIDRDRDRSLAGGLLPDDDPDELGAARLLLQRDDSIRQPMESQTGIGGNKTLWPQVLRLSLRAPPVAGGFADPNASSGPVDPSAFSESRLTQLARQRERAARDRERHTPSSASSSSSSASSSSASSSSRRAGSRSGASTSSSARDSGDSRSRASGSNRRESASAADSAINGALDAAGDAGDTASRPTRRASLVGDPAGEFEESFDIENERPRAPGVRAEFILLPDDAAPTTNLQSATATGGKPPKPPSTDPKEQGWTLWYRELPPRNPADDLSPEDRARALAGDTSVLSREIDPADLAYQVDPSSLRVIRLISGLRACHWQVFRRGQFDDRILALSARELPGYVEFQFETLSGRKEHWMFEVGWSDGDEPGQLVAVADDPLAPAEALTDAGETDENGSTTTNGGSGNGSTTGGADKPTTGGGNKPTTGGGGSKPKPPNKPTNDDDLFGRNRGGPAQKPIRTPPQRPRPNDPLSGSR